ncbi:MAG: endolytic transglycosylase MltG [Mycobacteriaceae bacterium]
MQGEDQQKDRVGPVRLLATGHNDSKVARYRKKMRRRLLAGGVCIAVFGLIALLFLWFLDNRLNAEAKDFSGPGVQDMVIEIRPQDTATAIGQTLVDQNVVASVEAFITAAQANSQMSSIQPGFYQLRTQISARDAVSGLLKPSNRVGNLIIAEGRQLDDVEDVKTGKVTKGIFSLISEASCVVIEDKRSCLDIAELRRAASEDALTELGVPVWAMPHVLRVNDGAKRLEGLILAGSWDFDPTKSASVILAKLVTESAAKLESSGILTAGTKVGLDPYQILIAASLVQREAQPADFAKVARVVYNRLAINQKLEFDSTVNYPLDRQEVATSDADRAAITEWNTYALQGLPATPICSPSAQAITAAENPIVADWLYFVTIDLKGTTLFTHSYEEHLKNIELAQRSGILDSGR